MTPKQLLYPEKGRSIRCLTKWSPHKSAKNYLHYLRESLHMNKNIIVKADYVDVRLFC